MTNVFLTESLKCDGSDPSISEAMFLWTMSSVNAQLPCSFKIPSVCTEMDGFPAFYTHAWLQILDELSPIPNPHRRNWAILRESIRSGAKKRRYDDSEDDAGSSDPPVIVSSTLPLYKTPAPTTKKRKMGSPTVILKENAVAGPSTPRQRKTSVVPNAGRVPTLIQNSLPNTSKLRLMGTAFTKQKQFPSPRKHLYNCSRP